MSSASTRPPLRTYSKRKHPDRADGTLKRRRVLEDDELGSTPSSDLPSSDVPIYSDENVPPSTPPSSPPSLVLSPVREPSMPEAADSIDKDNTHTKCAPKPKKRLVQMQLNFGQTMQRRCKECGMEYVPSAPEDAALHKKFHAQHMNGVIMDKEFLKKIESSGKPLWRGRGAFIISLSGSQDPKPWLKKARAVFDMATSDLGAVDIPDEKLWGCEDSTSGDNQGQAKASTEKQEKDRYKMYLYLDGGRCVGLCLVEHIAKAYKTMGTEKATKVEDEEQEKSEIAAMSEGNKPLVVSEEADAAAIGISRIWTSRGVRKKGIATAMLKCVERSFRSGGATPRDMIAFSQPTEMGTALARRWFGKRDGWHVYVD